MGVARRRPFRVRGYKASRTAKQPTDSPISHIDTAHSSFDGALAQCICMLVAALLLALHSLHWPRRLLRVGQRPLAQGGHALRRGAHGGPHGMPLSRRRHGRTRLQLEVQPATDDARATHGEAGERREGYLSLVRPLREPLQLGAASRRSNSKRSSPHSGEKKCLQKRDRHTAFKIAQCRAGYQSFLGRAHRTVRALLSPRAISRGESCSLPCALRAESVGIETETAVGWPRSGVLFHIFVQVSELSDAPVGTVGLSELSDCRTRCVLRLDSV